MWQSPLVKYSVLVPIQISIVIISVINHCSPHFEPFLFILVNKKETEGLTINPLTPMSDQDIISPYNINTISTR